MASAGRRWALVVAAVLLLPACGGGPAAQPPSSPRAKAPSPDIEIPIGQALTLGVSAALTGDQGVLGSDLADAVELAVRARGASVGGHPMRVVRMDDGCSDAQKAASTARALVGDRTLAGVVGPMCTTGAQAADSIYDTAHVIHILPAATRADLSQQGEGYFFRTAWLDDAQARTQGDYLRVVAGVTTTVLVDDTEPYGKTLADGFASTFGAGGGTVASRERIARGETDFGVLVRKVISIAPQAVVFEGLNPEAALLLQALRRGGYGGWFVAPDAALNARDFIEPLRDKTTNASLAEGALVTGGATPDGAFVAGFQEAFQREPSTAFVLQAYDAATALLTAIETAGEVGPNGSLIINRERLRDALRAEKFGGLTGAITFDGHGDRAGLTPLESGVAVYKVVDGRFQVQ